MWYSVTLATSSTFCRSRAVSRSIQPRESVWAFRIFTICWNYGRERGREGEREREREREKGVHKRAYRDGCVKEEVYKETISSTTMPHP